MGLFDSFIESAVNAGLNAIKEGVQEEIIKTKEDALKSSDEIFIQFNANTDDGETLRDALFHLFSNINEILMGVNKNLVACHAYGAGGVLYNGNFAVIQGVDENGFGGITIYGEKCLVIAKQIISALKKIGFISIQYIDGPILYQENDYLHSLLKEKINDLNEQLEYFKNKEAANSANEYDGEDDDEYDDEDEEADAGFCTKCGNKLSSGNAFCSKCGNKV